MCSGVVSLKRVQARLALQQPQEEGEGNVHAALHTWTVAKVQRVRRES